MKKVHLDLGTHYGQGLNQFISMLNIDKSWQVYSFEANPITYQNFIKSNHYKNLLNHTNLIVINKAVYNKDTILNFNTEYSADRGIRDGMASTLMRIDDWKPNIDNKHNFTSSTSVECIDLARFVDEIDADTITCKMDIEGAEFDVLEHLIATQTILKFQSLWIEFHNLFFTDKNLYFNKKNDIIQYLNKNNIRIYDWH